MVNFRLNTFETNSSSTHSLCIVKNGNKNKEEDLLKSYTIVAWDYNDKTENNYIFTSIKDKLTYLYSVFAQTYYGDEEGNIITKWESNPLCIKLHSLVPNLTFIPTEHTYTFEDAEWFYSGWDEEGEYASLLEGDNLKEFLLNGIICFFNRDDENQVAEYRNLDKLKIFCEWSG